jgi:hypothetical protein
VAVEEPVEEVEPEDFHDETTDGQESQDESDPAPAPASSAIDTEKKEEIQPAAPSVPLLPCDLLTDDNDEFYNTPLKPTAEQSFKRLFFHPEAITPSWCEELKVPLSVDLQLDDCFLSEASMSSDDMDDLC